MENVSIISSDCGKERKYGHQSFLWSGFLQYAIILMECFGDSAKLQPALWEQTINSSHQDTTHHQKNKDVHTY